MCYSIFLIEGGSHGLVTFANASEGHLMSDSEMEAEDSA